MFVDTNVLVKARILEALDHEIARDSLESAFAGPEPLRISRQVLREYLAVVTRPQTWPVVIAREDALDDVERLVATFDVLEDGPVVTDQLVSLCREVPVSGRQITTPTSSPLCWPMGSAGCLRSTRWTSAATETALSWWTTSGLARPIQ